MPSLRPSNSRRSVAGAFSRPCCTSTLFLIFPACTQPARAPIACAARHIIEHEETLHPSALNDQVEVAFWPRRRLGLVVVRDPATKHDAPAHREARQRRVEDVAADIVKENVDPFGTQLLQPRLNVL